MKNAISYYNLLFHFLLTKSTWGLKCDRVLIVTVSLDGRALAVVLEWPVEAPTLPKAAAGHSAPAHREPGPEG